MTELDRKSSCLYLVHTTVTAKVIMDILTGSTVVGYSTNGGSQLLVIGRNGTSISQGTKILAWIEAMTSSMTKGTSSPKSVIVKVNVIVKVTLNTTPMGLSIILNEEELMMLRDGSNTFSVGALPIEMNHHDGLSPFSNSLFHETIIHLTVQQRRFNKDRRKTTLRNGKDRGNKGIGRHDNLIPFLQAPQFDIGTKYQRQRIEPIRTGHTEACTDILRIGLFESGHSPTLQIPPTVHHLTDSLSHLCLIGSIQPFQFQVLHRVHS